MTFRLKFDRWVSVRCASRWAWRGRGRHTTVLPEEVEMTLFGDEREWKRLQAIRVVGIPFICRIIKQIVRQVAYGTSEMKPSESWDTLHCHGLLWPRKQCMNSTKLWHDVTKSQFIGPGWQRRTDSFALSNSPKEIAALKMVMKAY